MRQGKKRLQKGLPGRVVVVLPPDVKEALHAFAKKEGRPVTYIIRKWVETYAT